MQNEEAGSPCPESNAPSEQSRQALRGRRQSVPRRQSNPGRTPNKAEGEVSDVEEALQRQEG
jgi:hypothetical protein